MGYWLFYLSKRATVLQVVTTTRRGDALTPSLENRQYLGRVGGRGTHLMLASVILPLTMHHPFRDGEPLSLLTETPPTFGRL